MLEHSVDKREAACLGSSVVITMSDGLGTENAYLA